MVTTRAEVLGTTRQLVWFRIPSPHGRNTSIIITQPRSDLPRGLATVEEVDIEFDGVVHSGSEDQAPYSGYYVENPKVTQVEQESDSPRT